MKTLFVGILLSFVTISSFGCTNDFRYDQAITELYVSRTGPAEFRSGPVELHLTQSRDSKQVQVELAAGIYSVGATLKRIAPPEATAVEILLERVEGSRRVAVPLKTFSAAGEGAELTLRSAAVVAKGTYIITFALADGATSASGVASVSGFGNVVTKSEALASASFIASLDLGPWTAEDLGPTAQRSFYDAVSIAFASNGRDIVKPGSFTSVISTDVVAAISSGIDPDGTPLSAAVRAELSSIASSDNVTALFRGETANGKFYIVLRSLDRGTSIVTAFALGSRVTTN